MCHRFFGDARFWPFLSALDRDLAEEVRQKGCPRCKGALHSARYPRKPRGGPDDLPADYRRRLSYCCAREGCRGRTTPPSVRFLGRKIYLGVVVVLVTAMRQGPTPKGVAVLKRRFGVDRRTIARWQELFAETFRASRFWMDARARLSPPVDEERLPRSLLDRFRQAGHRVAGALVSLLRFLSPITTVGGLALPAT